MPVQFGTFKGHRTITLNPSSRFPFRFGQEKARLIVEEYEAIKAFAEEPSVTRMSGPDRFDMAVEDRMARDCQQNPFDRE